MSRGGVVAQLKAAGLDVNGRPAVPRARRQRCPAPPVRTLDWAVGQWEDAAAKAPRGRIRLSVIRRKGTGGVRARDHGRFDEIRVEYLRRWGPESIRTLRGPGEWVFAPTGQQRVAAFEAAVDEPEPTVDPEPSRAVQSGPRRTRPRPEPLTRAPVTEKPLPWYEADAANHPDQVRVLVNSGGELVRRPAPSRSR